MGLLIQLGIFAALLALGFLAGSRAERKHYASIREREAALRHILLVPVLVLALERAGLTLNKGRKTE